MTTVLTFCAPEWHDGESVPAQYRLKLENRDQSSNRMRFNDFFACAEHIHHAYQSIKPTGDEFVTLKYWA